MAAPPWIRRRFWMIRIEVGERRMIGSPGVEPRHNSLDDGALLDVPRFTRSLDRSPTRS
jgi:hypothetical protein